MGYANVFWVNEQPIRTYLSENGKDENIAKQIGQAVLELTVHDAFRREVHQHIVGLLGEPNVFSSVGSFHSTDFAVLVWTGRRLVKFPDISAHDFRCLAKLDSLSNSSAYVAPLREQARRAVISRYQHSQGYKHDNPLASTGKYSIYWIYEDFTRDYAKQPQDKWPTKDVGEAILKLMLDVWHSSAQIRNHGNALSKAASFVEPESAIFIWVSNCLRRLRELDESEQQKMIEWLNDNSE